MRQQNKIVLSLATTLILANSVYAKKPTSLDAITVTANKVEEKIQEVPISMTVFDEFAIEDRKIESIKDIAPHTSNFVLIHKTGSGYAPSIRGISNPMGYALSNPSSVIVDGIPISSSNGFSETLMDIERIEVLKGPQGTLYGKDAEAGVINVITKKPTNETRGKIGIQLGSNNKKEISLSASGPIVKDKLYIGVSAKHYEKDGFIKNTLLGGYIDDRKNDYGKVNLRYTPTDNLEVSLISSKLKSDNGAGRFIVSANPSDKSISTDIKGYIKSTITAHALKVSYTVNDYLLESITTYRNIKDDYLSNYQFPPTMNFLVKSDENHDKYSQEFRLSNNSDSFKWVAGVYADKDEKETSSAYIYPNAVYPSKSTLDADSVGIFIHTDYAINDKLSFISGARYDKDNRGFENKTSALEFSDSEISPKISLKYQQNQNTMYYSTISKGYRVGGFHASAPKGYSKQYDSETLWNYEVGTKNSFLDNRLTVNSSLFYMDIDNMQVKIYPNTNNFKSYVGNAAKATSKGFEIELNAKVTDTLELFGSYGHTDITFDEYKDAKGDYRGNSNIFAPKYNYNIGVQYRDVKGYFARADINGYGKTYFNKENTNSRDAYSLVNAKVGYEAEDYDIYLYGKNILDKEYDSVSLFNMGGTVYSEPREIGVQLAYRF